MAKPITGNEAHAVQALGAFLAADEETPVIFAGGEIISPAAIALS